MKLWQKWSSLFHNVLQSEESLDYETVKQALVLINWMYDEYEQFHLQHGYRIPDDRMNEKNVICHALKSKLKGLTLAQNWPIDIFDNWKNDRPFHEAVGSQNLGSRWDDLWQMAKCDYLDNPQGERI